MNRREFQSCLLSAIAAATAPSSPANEVASGPATYGYRFRWVRKDNEFWVWMRVRDVLQPNRSLPVKLLFANDPDAVNVALVRNYLTAAVHSHIVRDKITVDPGTWVPGSPLFATLRVDAAGIPSRSWRLSTA